MLLRRYNVRSFTITSKAFFAITKISQHNELCILTGNTVDRALTPIFGNGAGAHGIAKISGVLTKIRKFDIVLMYDVSIARFIPLIKLTFFLDI